MLSAPLLAPGSRAQATCAALHAGTVQDFALLLRSACCTTYNTDDHLRLDGIEPPTSPYERPALPLSYKRVHEALRSNGIEPPPRPYQRRALPLSYERVEPHTTEHITRRLQPTPTMSTVFDFLS